jgi:hypothetical protein
MREEQHKSYNVRKITWEEELCEKNNTKRTATKEEQQHLRNNNAKEQQLVKNNSAKRGNCENNNL